MKLSAPMMRALVKVSSSPTRPTEIPSPTRGALERRGLIETYSPLSINGQPTLFPGAHPDHLRVTDAGRPYVTLARLGVKTTTRRKK